MANLQQETYSVLRYGGATRARACAECCVSSGRSFQLEAHFRIRRPGVGTDAMRPKFARHEAHVERVLAFGGYPKLSL